MNEELVLNKLEKEVILKVREITQQNHIGYNNSTFVKKATYCKSGLKKGNKFTNSEGKKVNITAEKEKQMKDFIIAQILDYEKQRLTRYFPLIKKNVREKFDIKLSPAYLSNIKKKLGEEDGSE